MKKRSFNILLLAALAFWLLLFRLRTFSLFIVLQVLLKDFFKVGRFPRPNRKLGIISSPASGSIMGFGELREVPGTSIGCASYLHSDFRA